MTRWQPSYWLWRIGFEWRYHIARKVARHFFQLLHKAFVPGAIP